MKNMVAQRKKTIFQMTMCFRVTSCAQKLAFDFVSSIENCTKIPQLDFSVIVYIENEHVQQCNETWT